MEKIICCGLLILLLILGGCNIEYAPQEAQPIELVSSAEDSLDIPNQEILEDSNKTTDNGIVESIVCEKDGMCYDGCTIDTDYDCLLEELSKTKYTIHDVEEIKVMAKDCKFNMELCIDSNANSKEYSLNVKELYSDNEYNDGLIKIWVTTPFFEAVKNIAVKERNYEDYTDAYIVRYLSINKIYVHMGANFGLIQSTKEYGRFDNFLLKANDNIFRSEDISGKYDYDTKTKVFVIGNFSEYDDEVINFIIIGDKGEFAMPMNIKNIK